MNRKLVSIILVIFVIATTFSIVRFATFIEGPVIVDTTWEAKDIKVGAYYYVWYTGNWTKDHANCPDTPVLGRYNSSDTAIIQNHTKWFAELGIDFLILSWWGIDSLSDKNTKIMFAEVEKNLVVELAIMIEPFNESYGQSGYNFTELYNYIYDSYATKDVYMKLNNKPLLCFFNGNLTKDGYVQSDDRFEMRLVGSKFNEYNNWEYEVPCISDTEPPHVVDYANQHLCVDGEIMVCPRYHAHGWERDLTLAEGLYDKQWSRAIKLAREDKVNIVMIISWNEFAERTFIEPAVDSTSYSEDPYLLFNKTKEYINILKGIFTFFVKEMLENVGDLGENQCRYNVTDDQECRLDTIKIIENPEGGYLGVYHFMIGGSGSQFFQVRLANSTDLLHWHFNRTIEGRASQPTIAQAPNGAYIVAFEKHVFVGGKEERHLGFYYFPNLTSLLTNSSACKFIAPLTVAVQLEGTPNIYNITIENSMMKVCVGFHYNNAFGLDRVAVGHLTVPLDSPQGMIWNCTTPQYEYNQKLLETDPNIKGHIGDRDYGQIFGRNFSLQEAQYVKSDYGTWNIYLYDHSTGNFTKLNITTHYNATSFGNPTFTFLKSPNGNSCIVVTYFLFSEGLSEDYKDKAGELVFYKEFKTESFNLTHEGKSYSINVTSNSTISDFNFSETERSISFNVSGLNDSKGFCVVEIPKELVQNLWQSNYTVLLKGKQWLFENWTCTENTYIYVKYIHSTHKVVIIPEFPSFLILPLFMIATLLAVIIHRKNISIETC